MVFQFSRAAQGGAYWSLFMSIFLFNNYSPMLSPPVRAFVISLVPGVLVALKNNPYFVNPKSNVLAISTFTILLYMAVLQSIKQPREAMKEPTKNLLGSGLIYTSVAIIFGVAFVAASAASAGGFPNSNI